LPKVTFHNLPEIKKQTLILAAKKEFSRVPLYEASISNIIKTAKIPRGSFYQYFEDKEDLFFYLLNELMRENRLNFMETLTKNAGNLFDTMIEFFHFMISKEEEFYFMRNTFLNMTYRVETTFARMFNPNEQKDNFEEINSFINKENLNLSSDEEIYHALQIISAVTFRNFVVKFAKELSIEEAMQKYTIELNLLKKGLVKR